jgi:hypothetical protein
VLLHLAIRVDEVYGRRLGCGTPWDYALPTPASTPPVPPCVQGFAIRETRAAEELVELGYPVAGAALAATIGRLAHVQCPAAEQPPGTEPIRCSCGDRVVAPNPIIYGLFDGWPLGADDDLFFPGGCVNRDGRQWYCPSSCSDAKYAPVGSRASRRARGPAVPHRYFDAGTVFGEDPWHASKLRTFFDVAARCGGGAAEWTGSWSAWNSTRPKDQCVADAARDSGLAPRHWAALEVFPYSSTSP